LNIGIHLEKKIKIRATLRFIFTPKTGKIFLKLFFIIIFFILVCGYAREAYAERVEGIQNTCGTHSNILE